MADTETRTSRWRAAFGKGTFDDRIDVRPDINTREALALIGRSTRFIGEARGLFLLKFLLQLGIVVPALYLPWLLRIVIDNAALGEPLDATLVRFPPFMAPVLQLVEGQPPLDMMLTLTVVFVAMLVLFGSRAAGLQVQLLQGQDAATQAENSLNAGGSAGGGAWGLAEFMVHVRLTQTLANRLRTRLFRRLARMPMTALDDQRIGDSIYRVLYDAPLLPGLVYELTFGPFFMLVSAVTNLYVLQYSYGQVAPELVFIAWLTVPLAFAVTFPFSGALRRTNQNKRAAGAAATNTVEESLSQVAAVQSLGAGERERERFATRSSHAFLRERHALAVVLGASAIAFGALGLGGIYVTVLVTDRIIEGAMSVGDFATLIGIYGNIVVPVAYFGAFWIKLQDHIAAVRRVFFFLDFPSEADRVGGVSIAAVRAGVTFEHVSFAYPGDARDSGSGGAQPRPALRDVSARFRVGELIAIVGPTGSGKTTLAQLIPNYLTATSGRVLVDGRDVRDIEQRSLRRQVTYVFQEHLLLSESIRANMLLGNPDATDAAMRAALGAAGCLPFVDALPDGLDTVLGRAGDTLSVGQQQRLSIARGLVRDTPVLILDEPTAALDPKLESTLVASLKAAAKNRLVIVIAHRLSTVRNADAIVFLEAGEVREVGTHEALMARPEGAYRGFVALQSG